jgi:hypothetical protein
MQYNEAQRAAVRAQLAAARASCQYPGCDAQATGVLTIGKTAPFLCDPHWTVCVNGNHPDYTETRLRVEQELSDQENRTRYPNGLTRSEWHKMPR